MKTTFNIFNKVRYGALLALMLPIYFIFVILAFIINLRDTED